MIQLPPPTVATPEDLLAEFERTGDTAPFEEIVRRYSGMVYGVCYRVTRNAHDAEDAAQATFLKLATHARVGFTKTGSNGGMSRVGPWLQQVAKTTAVDLRRSKTRRQNREQIRAAIQEQQQASSDATDDASMDELKQLLRDEVDRLPVHYRTPLILYYFGGLSTEQIAVELKTNAKALAVRLFRARKMLGSRLASRGVATAGASFGCLAVADAILAALAGNVWKGVAGGAYAATGAGSGMSAAWATSHATICAVIASRINATMRAAAIGMVASKWKMSVAMLLTVGTTMAGTSDMVQQAPVVQNVGRWIQDVGQFFRDIGNFPQVFRGAAPRLQANVGTTSPPPELPPAPVPIRPLRIEPASPPTYATLPRPTPSPARLTVPSISSHVSDGLAGVPLSRRANGWHGMPEAGSVLRSAHVSGQERQLGGTSAGAVLLAMNSQRAEQNDRSARTQDQRQGGLVLGQSPADAESFVGPVALAASAAKSNPLMIGTSASRVGPYAANGNSTGESSQEGNPSAIGPIAVGPAASAPGDFEVTQDDASGSTLAGANTGGLGAGGLGYEGRTSEESGMLPSAPYGSEFEFIDPAPVLSPIVTPPATQPIPEPAATALLALGAVGLLARRRRRVPR